VRPLVVAALGGNALLHRGEPPCADAQQRNVAVAVRAIAEIATQCDLVITHGNGPQVGLLALQSAAEPSAGPYPLDVLGAESEGMIGYMLEQGLRNELPGRNIATLLTQVVVDAGDPAFARPTKPIGPVYAEAEARRLAAERRWTVARDGDGFRRVVPSPEPRRIVELSTIRLLLAANVIVICAGGGGIPVLMQGNAGLRGVEAVIDKDLSAELLARHLAADVLLMLTDVAGVRLRSGIHGAEGHRRLPLRAEHRWARGNRCPGRGRRNPPRRRRDQRGSTWAAHAAQRCRPTRGAGTDHHMEGDVD
jgi:carbamate kinase